MYREALLPLLLSDAALVLFGPEGHRLMPIHEVFDGRLRLLPGEFIIAAQVPRAMAQAPFTHIKRTFTERIGYPAVTVAALRWQGELRVAFSGLGSAPFRSGAMEQALNNRALPAKERVEGALSLLPEPPMDSCEGSGGYRAQLLALALEEVLEVLG